MGCLASKNDERRVPITWSPRAGPPGNRDRKRAGRGHAPTGSSTRAAGVPGAVGVGDPPGHDPPPDACLVDSLEVAGPGGGRVPAFAFLPRWSVKYHRVVGVDRREQAMCTEKCFELTKAAAAAGRAAEPAARHTGSAVTRRTALLGGAAVAASAALGGTAQAGERAPAFPRGRHRLRDLTYPLTTSFPAFSPGEEAARRTLVTIENDGYYLQEWRIIEHIGTHVDAPGHFTVGGRLAPELRLSELIVPAVVIDIAERAAQDPDTVVTIDDVRSFERRHGRVPRDAAVLMYSGWGAKVGDPDAYRGTDAAGTLHFPGFGPDTTEWLLRRRGIRSLGVDTLSIDPGNSTTFETHLILTGADRYGVENLANLDRIPKRGATIVVGLIPYEEGSGGQARVFASW
jgi:kynurenine formamidase